jgi:hypothetical protein
MAVHAVCETTNLRAVHYAERIWDAISDKDIDNGTIGYIDGQAEEGGVIYNFVAGTKEGMNPVLVHMPEWNADTSNRLNQRKDKFFNEAGVPFRVFTLKEGDEFALSPEGFAGTPEVGKYVSVNADGKLAVADAAVEGAVMVGKIMRKRPIGSTLVTPLRTYGYERMMYTVKVESLA